MSTFASRAEVTAQMHQRVVASAVVAETWDALIWAGSTSAVRAACAALGATNPGRPLVGSVTYRSIAIRCSLESCIRLLSAFGHQVMRPTVSRRTRKRAL